MSALDLGLWLAGLPPELIKEIDDNLPRFQRIATAATQIAPDVTAVLPLIEKLVTFAKEKET